MDAQLFKPEPTATPVPTLTPTETPQPQCDRVRVSEYADSFLTIFDEWLDAEKLTESTARIQLSPQIANLQEIKQRTSKLSPPPCLNLAHENMVSYMEKMIDFHIAFMGESPDSDIAKLINEAGGYLDTATGEITRIGQCAPNCD